MAWRLPLMSNFLSLVHYVIAQPITLWQTGKSIGYRASRLCLELLMFILSV